MGRSAKQIPGKELPFGSSLRPAGKEIISLHIYKCFGAMASTVFVELRHRGSPHHGINDCQVGETREDHLRFNSFQRTVAFIH